MYQIQYLNGRVSHLISDPDPILGIRLSRVFGWNSFDNVQLLNNTITYNEGVSNIVSTIPVGTYDISTLLTAITVQMTSDSVAGNTYTGTYSLLNNKVTISSSAGTFLIDLNSSFDLGQMLGYRSVQSLATSQVSTTPQLSTSYIEIRINCENSTRSFKLQREGVSELIYYPCNIPILLLKNSPIYYQNTNEYEDRIIMGRTRQISLTIEVYDEFGQLLDFNDRPLLIDLIKLYNESSKNVPILQM